MTDLTPEDEPTPHIISISSWGPGNYDVECQCGWLRSLAGSEAFAEKIADEHRHMHDMFESSDKRDPFRNLPG